MPPGPRSPLLPSPHPQLLLLLQPARPCLPYLGASVLTRCPRSPGALLVLTTGYNAQTSGPPSHIVLHEFLPATCLYQNYLVYLS